MSDFLAEARVLVLPDTRQFRAQLEAQLKAIHVAPLSVPIVAAGAGLAAAAGASGVLAAQQTQLQKTVLGLQSAESVLNSEIARQVPLLVADTAASAANAGAKKTLANSTDVAARRFGQMRTGLVSSFAALTGLRGAVLAASGPFLAAAIAATAFIKSLQAFAEFEQQLNIFAATAEATGSEMEQVSELARELGADLSLPAVSATDAAVALTELSKAGLSVEDAMGGARGVLQLATAAGITVGEAAQFAANELNAFGLAGDQATRVADVLTNAANSAQGSISDFGLAFKQSAAVANLVGLSLEDTAAQLTVLARAGLQGSDAGTSLRVALLRLINPTKEAAAIIKDLGINLRDAQGNLRPDVFVQFGEATARFTRAQRDAAFAAVFGADAIRTVSIAAEGGREALAEAAAAAGEQGSAAEQAAARTAGFGGQLEALQSTASTTAVSLGEVSTVLAGPLVVGLTGVANLLNQVLEPFAELVRITKQKLGVGTFDPTNESAAELILRLREVQSDFEHLNKVAGIGQAPIQNAIKDAIRGLENERSVLKALGLDITGVNTVIRGLQAELLAAGDAGVSGATAAEKALQNLKDLIDGLGANAPQALRDAMADLQAQIALAAEEGGRFAERFDRDFKRAAGSVDAVTAALGRLRGEVAASSAELLKAQNEGASPQVQLGILQAQEQTQNDIIARIKSDGHQAGDATAIEAARREIERIQGDIESLQQGIVSDQKAATTASEKLAKDAQEQRDKQFEAIAEMFGGRQTNIENAIERAGIAGNAAAQIRLNKALIASLQKERAALLERLKTLKVSNDLRKKILDAITAAIEEAQQDILRIQEEQKKKVEDFATPGADLRIRIAQARDNVAAEIAARRAKLALITKELVKLKNAGKKNTLAWLELKAQQQEEIAAIKELANLDKEDGKSARQQVAEFFFSQLQAQQGFAANLMGNLITGSTAGLVGVPSPPTQVRTEAAAAEGRAAVGPTFGQSNTEIFKLQQIIDELRKLNGSYDSPEAITQKKSSMTIMDGVGGV